MGLGQRRRGKWALEKENCERGECGTGMVSSAKGYSRLDLVLI